MNDSSNTPATTASESDDANDGSGDGDEPLEPDAVVEFEATGVTDEETLARLRTVSFYLDEAVEIPGTNYRVGLDPILGLVPGVGDATASALSAYILVEAAMLGVPRATLARMLGNVVLDATVGSIPLVGDVFDAAWKANARNVRLLEARCDDTSPAAAAADRRFLVAAVAAVTLLLVALGAATALVALWLLGQVGLL
ncbi:MULTISPECIES: DUF4112 domain-containing protein [Haloferax]|uniref:DUF4112 domain-containing protein n=3 Tax=Haloferax TaxID=2251 RepID=A0ACD5HXS7_9EURY|nr:MULTISPECIES: DUF4112 domain-containing protein [Haloferax]MBC9986687.1 DUF4112 domain-containing protein [Haloferax sp. AS1]ELK54863.1 hypothetical protein D320_07799 [Haloferax sp. BAB-2207]ELZ75037.1 hypothetical protein C456_07247 [Haloferax lucentense DSM 14919]QIB78986.1 DUF4112 domain-containing protein [Haloferax alexandrinus]RDZ39093.1 DUF4112 domain-containing protein [Haloferax sp. Atlit-47N]